MFLAAITALVIAGCGGGGSTSSSGGGGGTSGDTGSESESEAEPKAGGTLRVAEYTEAINLNPFESVDTASEQIFMQVVEPLYQTGTDGSAEPWLATSAKPSSDYKRWTLQLRKGVKFSDGKPLTSADVVFSLDKLVESPTWGPLYEAISTVKAAGPTAVEIQMSKPFPGLVGVLTLPFAAIVPKDYGGVSSKAFANKPVGTGPFELTSWKHGQSITLSKNPNYWQQGKPYVDQVVVTAPASDEARVLQLKGEQADLIASPPNSQVAALESTPGIRVEKSPFDLVNYLILNVEEPLFEDPRIREAIDLAVDRDAYIEAAENGLGEIGGSFLPSVVSNWDESIEAPAQDVAKAKKLVAEAVKDGADPSFELMIAAGEATATLGGQIVQEDLQNVGFKVDIRPIDTSSKIEAESTGNFAAALESVSTDIVDASELVGFFIGSKAFFAQADTSQMEALLNKATVEPDKAKVKQLYTEMQEFVAKEKELITMSYKPWIWAGSDDVVGFQLNAVGLPIFANAGFGE